MIEPEVRWLAIEALLPIFGAAFLFLVWGGLQRLVFAGTSSFVYHWGQALDPMGWLYGGAVLAVQAGAKGLTLPRSLIFTWVCFFAAVVCLLLLIAAMAERGKNGTWQPPILFTGVSIVLVGAILFAGFHVQLDVLQAQRVKDGTPTAQAG